MRDLRRWAYAGAVSGLVVIYLCLVGIVLAILSSPRKQGREDTVDSVVALFLDGAAFHQATPTPPEAQ